MVVSFASFAQTATQPTAETIMKTAYAKAAKENKKVLLMYHASWCGWCKKMDASLNDFAIQKLINDNYVVTHLDIMEQPAKKILENPGAIDTLKKLTGVSEVGLPYWFVLDAKGNVLATSSMGKDGKQSSDVNDNVGCPGSEQEVTYFDSVLRKTSNLKESEIAIIHKRMLQNQPAPQPAKPAATTTGSK